MKRKLGWAALILALCSGFALAKAPDMDLRTLDGRRSSLDEYVGKGKWTLVMFWATDCGICKREMPVLSAFHDKHKGTKATVLGVAIDGMDKVDAIRASMRLHQASFPTLVGELGVVGINFELAAGEPLRGTPTFLMFNPSGELVGVNPGPVRPEAVEAFMARKGAK